MFVMLRAWLVLASAGDAHCLAAQRSSQRQSASAVPLAAAQSRGAPPQYSKDRAVG